MTDERAALVERMARVLYEHHPYNDKWTSAVSDSKRWWRGMARAALAVAEPVVRADEREVNGHE